MELRLWKNRPISEFRRTGAASKAIRHEKKCKCHVEKWITCGVKRFWSVAAEMSLLPRTAADFSSAEYWERFFKKRGEKSFEWYGDYNKLCGVLHKYIKVQHKVRYLVVMRVFKFNVSP